MSILSSLPAFAINSLLAESRLPPNERKGIHAQSPFLSPDHFLAIVCKDTE